MFGVEGARAAQDSRVIAGKYEIDVPIGYGGMGQVFRARHLELGIDVAVKLLHPDKTGDPDAVERFRREARTVARIRSNHVVRVLDFGHDEGRPYLVMELLRGETLKERLAARDRLGVVEMTALVHDVCRALSVAHGVGIVHRDLKPSNLFIERSADNETVKILDFGIARDALDPDTQITRQGLVIGSHGYMSPEQRQGDPVDGRSDLWAVAAVAFRSLTGIRLGETPPASSVLVEARARANLPVGLDAFFERALQPSPGERFQDAAAFSKDFARATNVVLPAERPTGAAAAVPVETTTQTAPAPGGRFSPRVRAGAALVLALVGVVTAAVVVARATRAPDTADAPAIRIAGADPAPAVKAAPAPTEAPSSPSLAPPSTAPTPPRDEPLREPVKERPPVKSKVAAPRTELAPPAPSVSLQPPATLGTTPATRSATDPLFGLPVRGTSPPPGGSAAPRGDGARSGGAGPGTPARRPQH